MNNRKSVVVTATANGKIEIDSISAASGNLVSAALRECHFHVAAFSLRENNVVPSAAVPLLRTEPVADGERSTANVKFSVDKSAT